MPLTLSSKPTYQNEASVCVRMPVDAGMNGLSHQLVYFYFIIFFNLLRVQQRHGFYWP